MDNAPNPLDQFHLYEKAAKLAISKGDTEAANHLRDLAKAQLELHYQATENYDPAAGQGFGENLAAGIGQGAVDVGRHVGNLVGLESDEDLAAAKERDEPLLNTGAGKLGSFIGQTAVTAPLGVGTSAIASRLGSAGARFVANGIGRGVLEGTTQGAVMADPGHKGAGAIAGGLLGGSLPTIGGAVGKVARGMARTPAAQILLNAGVSLTPGMLRPGGLASMIEQAPILRWMMSGSKQAAKGDWQHALAQTVAAPGAKIQRGTAEEMLQQAKKSFDPLYKQADGFPVGPKIMATAGEKDVPLNVALQKAAATPGVTKEIQSTANGWLQSQLKATIGKAVSSKRGMYSEDLRDLRSAIRQKARDARAAGDTAGDMYNQVYTNAEDALTQSLESQLSGRAKKALQSADAQYVHFKQLESAYDKAAGAGRGAIGPTPIEVTRAVKTGAKQAGRAGQFAAGQNKSRLRELADAAGATFSENPEMRTGHSLPFMGLLGLGGAAAVKTNPWIAIPTLTGALGLGLTRTGRSAAAGQLPWQKILSRQLDKVGGSMGPLNKALLGEYTQRGLVTAEQPDAQYMLGDE